MRSFHCQNGPGGWEHFCSHCSGEKLRLRAELTGQEQGQQGWARPPNALNSAHAVFGSVPGVWVLSVPSVPAGCWVLEAGHCVPRHRLVGGVLWPGSDGPGALCLGGQCGYQIQVRGELGSPLRGGGS